MALDPVQTLQALIRIPSVNPTGRDVLGPNEGESRLTDYLQKKCEQLGWRWLRQPVHPGRENLVALVSGYPAAAEGGELILWDVHQDTVSADGMSVDPFGGEIRDGRVYGRGACDVKGSMAAMLAGLSRLDVADAKQVRPTIAIAFTANEECGFTGAKALTQLWHADTISSQSFFPRRPDAAIVAEPTDLNVIVAHQGVVRWRCHVEGRAAHTSRPDQGINAIYAMSRVVHERATIEIDRRIGPGEDPAVAFADLVRHVADQAAVGCARVTHDPPFMKSTGLNDESNRALAERLASLVGEGTELLGVPYGTDAAAIGARGVPTVVFGPGSIQQAHTADEFIEVAELLRATELFYQIAWDGLR
jgi:acetylornithine deacetylase